MARRFSASALSVGIVHLDADQSHHARDVMRLAVGDTVQLFDAQGRTASGTIVALQPAVALQVAEVSTAAPAARIIVGSAVPKGARADWMIEKMAEIGVSRFIPLQTARSVVHPEGAGKLDRWRRLADEAAKQSSRAGNLQIDSLMDLAAAAKLLSAEQGAHWFLSTQPPRQSFSQAVSNLAARDSVCLLIGPEGGWTPEEEQAFRQAGFSGVALTASVLRIETAVVAAAGAVASWLNDRD